MGENTNLKLFEAAFEQEALGMALRAVDPQNPRWLRVNQKFCDMLGYAREDLLQLTSIDITVPEDRPSSNAVNEQLLRGELNSFSHEKRYRRKDGRLVWVRVWLSVVVDSKSRASQIIAVIEDITGRKQTEAIRQEADNRFRSVVDSSPAGITLKNRDGVFLVVSRTYARWMNVDPTEIIGKVAHDFFPKEQADDIQAADLLVMESGEDVAQQSVRSFLDGVTRTVITHKTPIYSANKEVIAVSTVITDVSERVLAEEALREREQRFKDFAESASDWLWETDSDFQFTYLSDRFYEISGFGPNAPLWTIRDHHAEPSTMSDDGTGTWAIHLSDLDARKAFRNFEHAFATLDGTTRHARLNGNPVFALDGNFLGYRGTGTDITEAHELSAQLSYQASHDGLTQLINRREFERRLQRVLDTTADAQDAEDEHALCYLDLDQFKVINDTCGHMAGDELLRQLGQLLSKHVRKRDTLARLGGDEFGLLMEHCDLTQALRVANQLREAISEFRFIWEDQLFRIGVSIGLVPITKGSQNVAGLMSVADSACYAAKDEGRNRVHVFKADDSELARRHGEMRWVARINQALEDDRFQLWYQPIIPTRAGRDEGEHIELLLRMLDEQGECIAPGAFIPAAERYGLAAKLDRWMIGAAFEWLNSTPTLLDRLGLCSINLSGASMGDGELLQFVREKLTTASVPAAKICFEITETSAIANMYQAVDFMRELKKVGCKFSLDDFGSGMCSFAYLKTLPVDYLKIDGVFVKDILEDEVDLALVRSINDIAKVMGKRTVAEFVESAAIFEKVRELGIDFAQGFGIGRPVPVAQIVHGNMTDACGASFDARARK